MMGMRIRKMAMVALIGGGLLLPGAGALAHDATPAAGGAVASPAAAGSVAFSGLLDQAGPITVADLATHPAETVDVTYQTKKGDESHSFTGTRLWDLLDGMGIQLPADAKNGQLQLVVKVSASDGYVAVISLGEIDPDFGASPVLLAWEQDGEALSAPRLVVPGDAHGGRYVSDVVSIEVLAVN